MKYWFYSEGNILGPYDPAEMLALPAFAQESLVCPETATGDNAGDWRPAAQTAEIASALSVGAGRAVSAGVVNGAYEYETGFSSSVRRFEEKEPSTGASYGELLDTIDNILGAYKEGKDAPAGTVQEADYDLAEKFDIRLSRIQEELEAARWEKNLLLEKIRMKDVEEQKNRERINELEARLKGQMLKLDNAAKELELARYRDRLKEQDEAARRKEELKREEQALREEERGEAGAPAASHVPAPVMETVPAPAAYVPLAPAEPVSEPVAEIVPEAAAEPVPPPVPMPAPKALFEINTEAPAKALKTISPSREIKLETSLGAGADKTAGDPGLTSRTLRSLGQTQVPAYVYGSHYNKPLPGPEPAPAGAFKGPESLELLPQQAAGLVYDFTVVTDKPETSQRFKIETRQETAPSVQPEEKVPAFQPQPEKVSAPELVIRPEQVPAAQVKVEKIPVPEQAKQREEAPAARPEPVKTPVYDMGIQLEQPPAAQPEPVKAPVYDLGVQPQPVPAFQHPVVAQHDFQFQPQSSLEERPRAAAVPASSLRLAQAPLSPSERKNVPAEAMEKTVRVQAPMLKAKPDAKPQDRPRKKGGKLAFISILVAFASMAAGGLGYFFMGEGVSFSEFSMMNLAGKKKGAVMSSQLDAKAPAVKAEPAAQPRPAPAVSPAPAPEPAKPVNENIRKALDIVKKYKLSGGRGAVATWFANSFLSGAAGGSNEEWTATPLHGDILVVQYRLLRPRQDPLIYQFEVDAARQAIERGINNNAIELLDLSGREKGPLAARKPAAKARAKAKPPRQKSVPILPLPDAGAGVEVEPTGFEDVQAEGSDEVKYLKAQESDDELF